MKHYNNCNPNFFTNNYILNSPKIITTYQYKYFLKKRIISFNYKLNEIIVKAGFANNIKDANNLINNNNIKVNDIFINQSTYKCKSGDVIKTISSISYLNHYIKRWNSIKFIANKGVYQKYKRILSNNNLISNTFNTIIIK